MLFGPPLDTTFRKVRLSGLIARLLLRFGQFWMLCVVFRHVSPLQQQKCMMRAFKLDHICFVCRAELNSNLCFARFKTGPQFATKKGARSGDRIRSRGGILGLLGCSNETHNSNINTISIDVISSSNHITNRCNC